MLTRRSFMVAGGVATLFSRAGRAQQAWPTGPIKVVVPFAPGGGNDNFGRLVAKQLQDRLGVSAYVENRAGANGIIGLDSVHRSRPDGYSIATATTGPLDVNPWTTKELPYDPAKDFTYLANMVKFPLFLCVGPQLGVKSLREFLARAKSGGRPLTYSSAGIGNSTHLAGEVLANMTGTELMHVPYKGAGPAMVGVIGGEVDFTFGSGPSALSFVKAGKVLNLGVTDSRRVPDMPELKTIAEQGVPGYEVTSWGGIVAPAGLAADARSRLDAVLKEMMDDNEFKKQLMDQGMVPSYMPGPQFEAYVGRERTRWGELNRKLNIRTD
ncbi:tripartite tricarboxylate transporter substrate binding protein [Pigmentiphaga soli]|uniref:Tripartite tricarboxylate transporter substrate binding protein n=1 Tax=Pigmentiphaga soli TaxID=1007095 RepID=A0ABP8HEK1_9BURK